MKKIIIMCAIAISGFAMAQQGSDNLFLYEEPASHAEEDTFPGNPGDPVPIDEHIPLLMLIALSMVVVFARRKKKIDTV